MRMIQIHPLKFWIGDVEHVSLTKTMYIDPSKVESCGEDKDSDLWFLNMVSGQLLAISTQEFLKNRDFFFY